MSVRLPIVAGCVYDEAYGAVNLPRLRANVIVHTSYISAQLDDEVDISGICL